MHSVLLVPLVFCLLLVVSCDLQERSDNRWYTGEQVVEGKKVFAENCASCHGGRAQGLTKNWQVRLADGSYPAPPLDGSAHAWHHELPLLVEIVQKGGALFDGKMPAFAEVLNEQEQLAAIAWFQHLWSDDIYQMWSSERNVIYQNGLK